MKLVFKNIDKDGSGCIALVPEEPEDMWHAYNLIAEGDVVTASTVRKVQTESSTGSSTSNRVRTTLTIRVETIDFDTQACVLRLKGRNIVENQYVKLGAYHTLDLELNRKFTLQKILWDSVALERVEMACDPAASADVAAVVMQEGLAHVCLITPSMTLVRSKIDMNIPRKRKGFVQQHEKGLNKFYEAVMQGILRHIDFSIVKCVILASPGFVKDQFFDYMMQQAIKNDIKLLIENKSKFLLVKASSGFKHSLKEVLQEPAVMAKISDTKAASEVKLLESFYTMLQLEPAKAFYGKRHVEMANEAMAIETLMISDKLFRCQDILKRKEYVGLVDSARENGSDVRIFSSMHVSGEQLDQLTGIAAVLRFPMPELEDSDGDEENDFDSD
ncbi:protein pelota [Pararge aegeria]|uniref:Protein pelota homolog n=2 Tax=Pararge aegeria TaxID=116150 RepID=A0A8S4RTR4_9NEOP|nr:protein pelota [Pararge aegeria]CAH2241230.1 jg3294 [Pararge aegeria aegeria]